MISLKYLKGVIIFFILMIILVCLYVLRSTKREPSTHYYKTIYDDGNIKSEGIYHDDTTVIDTFRMFWHNGRLKILKECRNSFKINTGIYISYDSLGQLEYKTTFKNGLENGDHYCYVNGKLNWVQNKLNGEGIGGVWYYDTLDGHLKSYEFRVGPDSYTQYYGKDSSLCKQYGSILFYYTIVANHRIDSFKRNTDIHFQFMVPSPPYTKRKINIQERDTTGKVLRDTHIINDSTVVDWFSNFANNGWYRIFVKATLYDLKGNEEKSDSIVIPIIIGPNPNNVDVF